MTYRFTAVTPLQITVADHPLGFLRRLMWLSAMKVSRYLPSPVVPAVAPVPAGQHLGESLRILRAFGRWLPLKPHRRNTPLVARCRRAMLPDALSFTARGAPLAHHMRFSVPLTGWPGCKAGTQHLWWWRIGGAHSASTLPDKRQSFLAVRLWHGPDHSQTRIEEGACSRRSHLYLTR